MKPAAHVAAVAAGGLFGVGLAVSGMTQPGKVVGFLDVTGAWDPSLAFVMAGAVLAYMPLFAMIRRRSRALFGPELLIPRRSDLDWKLLAGASLFGIGWGVAGFCPGPALTSLATLTPHVLLFTGGMVAGMGAYAITMQSRGRQPQ